MAKPYSDDLRERAVAAIESGHTREEVAELYNLASSTVGGFIRRKRETGSVSPAKFDGHKTFVFAPHTDLVLCLLAIEPDAAGRYAQTYSYLLASRLLMKRSAVGGLTPNGSFDRLLASQWTRRRGPETMAITIDRGKVSVMPDELRPNLVYAMADAVDKMLLSWEPAPSLSEAISALVQSLARALSATTDPGPSLATVKDGVEHLLGEILRTRRSKPN